MHQRERTGGEIAWEELCWEGVALKMPSCWHGFYTEQLFITQRSFTLYTEELYAEDLLHGEACTQGGLHAQSLLHRETFTQERFYTQKLLDREVLTQRSYTE